VVCCGVVCVCIQFFFVCIFFIPPIISPNHTTHTHTTLHALASTHTHTLHYTTHSNDANIHTTTRKGATPAYIASQNGHLECLQLLIEMKADIQTATHAGCAPDGIARQVNVCVCVCEIE
jgi:hypothetical protein